MKPAKSKSTKTLELKEGLLKALTGGDVVTSLGKGERQVEEFCFDPGMKLFLSNSPRPALEDTHTKVRLFNGLKVNRRGARSTIDVSGVGKNIPIFATGTPAGEAQFQAEMKRLRRKVYLFATGSLVVVNATSPKEARALLKAAGHRPDGPPLEIDPPTAPSVVDWNRDTVRRGRVYVPKQKRSA